MSRLHDVKAEHALAGIATISTYGAHLLLERLDADDFYDPVAWWVIDAAACIPDDVPGDDPDPIDRRIDAIAAAIEIYPAMLRDWVTHTPSMWDLDGRIAARVRAAADRRREVEEHIAALEELGLKVQWDRAA